MSEATRSIALQHAITHAASKMPSDSVVEIAETFHTFITKDAAIQPKQPEANPAPRITSKPAIVPVPEPGKVAAPKPVAKAPANKGSPEKSEDELASQAIKDATAQAEKDEEAEAMQLEIAGKIIVSLLQAGKRDDAVKLLAKYGAKAKSDLKPKDYAAFIKDGEELLLAE